MGNPVTHIINILQNHCLRQNIEQLQRECATNPNSDEKNSRDGISDGDRMGGPEVNVNIH